MPRKSRKTRVDPATQVAGGSGAPVSSPIEKLFKEPELPVATLSYSTIKLQDFMSVSVSSERVFIPDAGIQAPVDQCKLLIVTGKTKMPIFAGLFVPPNYVIVKQSNGKATWFIARKIVTRANAGEDLAARILSIVQNQPIKLEDLSALLQRDVKTIKAVVKSIPTIKVISGWVVYEQ